MLIPIEKLQEAEKRFQEPSISHRDRVDKASLSPEESTLDGRTVPTEPEAKASMSVEENLNERAKMIASLRLEPTEFAFERAIGNNDSVYTNFCDFIFLAKRKIGRIVLKRGNVILGHATGFMVSERLMLTNWHVFKNIDQVRQSEVEFFYEYDVNGRPNRPTTFGFAVDEFFHSFEALDYCLIAVKLLDISGSVSLSSIGYHYLDPNLGKLGEEGIERLNIIHHPGGDYQQISIRENEFDKILDNTIWYKTDTAQGSSGSPVFNDQWQVVALHHSGVAARTADGLNYADKDGNPVLPVDGKIDGSKVKWDANEGIRISVLLRNVLETFPDNEYVAGLKKQSIPNAQPPGTNVAVTTAPVANAMNNDAPEHEEKSMENISSNVQITFPASLIESNGNITININNRSGVAALSAEQKPVAPTPNELADLFEIQRVDLENSFDYSKCGGYKANFLGSNFSVQIPKPTGDLLKFVAKPNGNAKSVLDYFLFSTIHHSVRKMPIISAINIDGNPDLRKDKTERVDVWLRDRRLDYEMQLNDKFYAGSNFDRGHMSRREDANYGATADEARQNADLTCVYTNACPQVPALNRSNRNGLWGKLEKKILEKGVEKEPGQSVKITVFNGPIFKENDRFFKGIQIPMEFWKIILWFGENKQRRATGFKLSQADLVADIDFEKLDFDTDEEFRSSRCSIQLLERLTGLDFNAIKQFDSFTGVDPNESVTIGSEEELNAVVEESFTAKPVG